ncbi:MAG: ATP-binding protein [Oscillospiraceae bacterium]
MLHIVQAAINLSVYMFFTLKTFQSHLKYSMRTSTVCAVCYSVFSIAIITLFLEDIAVFPQYSYYAIIAWTAVSVACAIAAFKVNFWHLLFYVFAIFEIAFNVSLVSRMVVRIFPSYNANSDIVFLHVSIIVLLLILPLMWYLFISLFKKIINNDCSNISWKMLFVLPASFFLYCLMDRRYYAPLPSAGDFIVLVEVLILNFSVFLSYVAVLKMLLSSQKSELAIKKATNTEQQMLLQKEQYLKLSEGMEQTARFRHDLRQNFIILKGYADSGNLPALEDYLSEYIAQRLPVDEPCMCENHSVDLVMRHYVALAKAEGIKIDTDVNVPQNYIVSDVDLCVLFGNLVENAFESCCRQINTNKFIIVKSKIIGDGMLRITVINSYEGSICMSGNSFVSHKHDGVGMGISSVEDIAERHGGSTKFTHENNIFKANVLLVS